MPNDEKTIILAMIHMELQLLEGVNTEAANARRALLLKAKEKEMNRE